MEITIESLKKRVKELQQSQQQLTQLAEKNRQQAIACVGAIVECQRLIKELETDKGDNNNAE